ncbi:GTPase [Lipingzhangella sp. LS1_29]|uniref:GTPase n=1 Tax=Lipingzhangella rawalii TaxID=2055835 RepID=A0ABU2H897_9ACTN|nr:dynamin family protein [Lipingzhangella rawalii]MDS1271080.1 GTPase [Lipingzhangella rawalii]
MSGDGTTLGDAGGQASSLEQALLELRSQAKNLRLADGLPGAERGEVARRDVLDQLDDFVLPRVRRNDVPMLIAVAGSTGAGKSTLVNSLVGEQVTTTGVRRPTTNSPVLACNPADTEWFSEASFLPTLPRVRQQGLAMPGKDGMLVLAASECMPPGVALLDTPDVDSVVSSHHEFAAKFLDAADLWVFVTTSARYADARVWEFLQVARDRDTSLAVVLSRTPRRGEDQLVRHFDAMLAANGLDGAARFTIPETDQVAEGRFTGGTVDMVRTFLADVAGEIALRSTVTRRTFDGVLESFRTRVPELARQVETQLEAREALAAPPERIYPAVRAHLMSQARDGSLLHGNLLARWRDLAASGELTPSLRRRMRRREQPVDDTRVRGVAEAVADSLTALLVSGAERAMDQVLAEWSKVEGGAELAAQHGLTGITEDFPERARASIAEWQQGIVDLVSGDGVAKRTAARLVTYDREAFAQVLTVGLLGFGISEASGSVGSIEGAAVPRRLLRSLFGAESLRSIGDRATRDLEARIAMLLDAEKQRFVAALSAANLPAETAAVHLYQAIYNIEIVR